MTRLRLSRLWMALGWQPVKLDDGWALQHLEPGERPLYLAMDPRDRLHAQLVARTLLAQYPQLPAYVLRAALLHDCGKAVRPYRMWERVLVPLLRWRVPAWPLRAGSYGAWQVYWHHPDYAARQIADPRVAALVLEHHHPQTEWGRRLHRVDAQY
jgi:hypothetical protein